MNDPGDVLVFSWQFDPWLLCGIFFTAVIYLRGWRIFHHRDPDRWPLSRPAAFLGGLATIALALLSPIEALAPLLLSMHMAQHLLFMMIAPPLIWLGHPLLPMVRGLPGPIRTYWIAPLFQSTLLRRVFAALASPPLALVLFLLVTWVWHSPALYSLALQSQDWHYVQHACFLGSGLVFWFPIIRPDPYRPAWSIALLIPYLIIADLSNTALSSLLTFSERVLYIHYQDLPPIWGGTSLNDQATAGVLMWVPGSLIYLVPLVCLGVTMLAGRSTGKQWHQRRKPVAVRTHRVSNSLPGRYPLPLLGSPAASSSRDLMKWPVVGHGLRWRYARPFLQAVLLVVAAAVVVDGLTGPNVATMNLAGVLVWVHWRGLLILTLLAAGNFFCTVCPLTLPRWLARNILPPGRNWPRALRGKWVAIVLLIAFFASYELFSLWDRPRLTALIILGYFVAAFVVDARFRGAAFCKYVCPIGQFNFVQSLVSPLEIQVREQAICATCRTRDCIRGRDDRPGCGLDLFLPVKQGNMNCTMCLDCVHACPHDNVGLVANWPGRRLWNASASEVGLASRWDIKVLILLVVFAAFVNAAGMTEPVLRWEEEFAERLSLQSTQLVVLLLVPLSLIVIPTLLMTATAAATRRLGQVEARLLTVISHFTGALVPLGCAMWLAHYGYHLASSYQSAWPVIQRFMADHGSPELGEPSWIFACCHRVGNWVIHSEILALDCGLLASLYCALATSRRITSRPQNAYRMWAPWALLLFAIFALGVWIVLQPMPMRGNLTLSR